VGKRALARGASGSVKPSGDWMSNRPWLLQRHAALLKRTASKARDDALAIFERRLAELGLRRVA
jgi:hypothetical protein